MELERARGRHFLKNPFKPRSLDVKVEKRLAKLAALKRSLPAYRALELARSKAHLFEHAAAAATAAPRTPPEASDPRTPKRVLEGLVQRWKWDLQQIWFPRFEQGLRPPGLEGPTPEQIDGAGFSMTFFGKGFTSEEAVRRGRPDKQVVTKIRGPEPGELNAFGTGSAESVGLTGRPARPPPQATSRARSSWPTPRWSCWRSPGSSARPACGPPASSCSGPATSTACGRAASPSPPS